MIRVATIDDIDGILYVGQHLLARGAFRGTGFNALHATNRLLRAIMSPNEWLGVAAHESRIVGFLLLTVQPYWWNQSAKQVLDDGMYCERAGCGSALIREGMRWARTVPGVTDIMLTLNSKLDDARTAKVLNAIGFECRGMTLSATNKWERRRWAA